MKIIKIPSKPQNYKKKKQINLPDNFKILNTAKLRNFKISKLINTIRPTD